MVVNVGLALVLSVSPAKATAAGACNGCFNYFPCLFPVHNFLADDEFFCDVIQGPEMDGTPHVTITAGYCLGSPHNHEVCKI